MNFSDSERVSSLLTQNHWQSTDQINQADLVIFNTCGVRQTAEDRLLGQIHNLRKTNPETIIVVTGCLARRQDVKKKLLKNKSSHKGETPSDQGINQGGEFSTLTENPEEILFLPIKNLTTLPQLLSEKFPATSIPFKAEDYQEDYLSLTPHYQKSHSILVPIMTGCNNFCSYCVVPYARGPEVSRSPKNILEEVEFAQKQALKDKKTLKEVLLLGQNVNSYSYQDSPATKLPRVSSDISRSSLPVPPLQKGARGIGKEKRTSFPLLLEKLAQKFPAINFRFLTSHPKDFSQELIEIIQKYPNLSRQIHLPVQSGSERILKAMNRHYTPGHYLELVSKIKNALPDAQLSTDVIVGFPSETEEDFQATAEIFRQVRFQEAYINKYSPRPGTTAEKLGDPIPWNEKKHREKELRKILETKKSPAK